MKWKSKRGCRSSHCWMAGVLCVDELSQHNMDFQLSRYGFVDQVEELFELGRPVAGGELMGDHARWPSSTRRRGRWCRGGHSHGVRRSGVPGSKGKPAGCGPGPGRPFSRPHKSQPPARAGSCTKRRCRGPCRRKGVGRQLEGVLEPGLSPKAFHIRLTVGCDIPSDLASPLVDQWVASVGFSVSVFTITASIDSPSMLRGPWSGPANPAPGLEPPAHGLAECWRPSRFPREMGGTTTAR